jgi:hypothetical protein
MKIEPMTVDQKRCALERYLSRVLGMSAPVPLNGPPLPYNTCPRIEIVRWRNPLINLLVRDELRELTNTLNDWRARLRCWNAWLEVLDEFPKEEALLLQHEFVNPIAFMSLLYPSAMRDRIAFVATNALHQVRLTSNQTYVDRLESDPDLSKTGEKTSFPSRKQKTKQLRKIAGPLRGSDVFMATLQSLNDKAYRDLTRDFRNLSSHAIAPHFNEGSTSIVSRAVVRAKKLVQKQNGWFEEEVPDNMQATYLLGETLPLPMRLAFSGTLEEFEKALTCFWAYVALLDDALGELPAHGSMSKTPTSHAAT